MSENESKEELEKLRKNARVIQVKHTFENVDNTKDTEEGIETIKEERDSLKAIVGTVALQEFSKSKSEILQSVPESNREKIEEFIGDDPDRLEQIKGTLLASGKPLRPSGYDWASNPEDIETPPPKGLVGLPSASFGKKRGVKGAIDEIYAILENPNADYRMKAEAERRATLMFRELMKGRKQAIRSGNPNYQIQSWTCPQCGKIVTEPRKANTDPEKCPYCGWTQKIDKSQLRQL